MIQFQFNSIKTTQACAYLLAKSNGCMSKGILIKMLYLTDRALLEKRGQPLTGDQPVSMKNGPVLSATYDLTNGCGIQYRAYWEQYITDAPKGHTYVSLKRQPEIDRLSKSELRALDEIFEEFKNFTWTQMVSYCHALPEWKNPGDSSSSIQIEQILAALGKTREDISEIQSHAVEARLIDLILPNQVPA